MASHGIRSSTYIDLLSVAVLIIHAEEDSAFAVPAVGLDKLCPQDGLVVKSFGGPCSAKGLLTGSWWTLWPSMDAPGDLLEASWVLLEASWRLMAPSWTRLGHSWRPLERCWSRVGGVLGAPGAVLEAS